MDDDSDMTRIGERQKTFTSQLFSSGCIKLALAYISFSLNQFRQAAEEAAARADTIVANHIKPNSRSQLTEAKVET